MYDWLAYGYFRVVASLNIDDVPKGTDIRTNLDRINDSKNIEELIDKVSDISNFNELAGCTIPIKKMEDKEKIISSCVKFYKLDRAQSAMTRWRIEIRVQRHFDVCYWVRISTPLWF
ncbi:hypothetical protein LOTGIDRAFT_153393 [Lottia gigantea]|uniref:Uncharacterized protein n=1 Tax=Lottia gigantea TaxID=225164 RepID=V4AFM6_LOTGI|nr:hypothetical protein LOTGIDRAFT_153393 [Lottia gigantea]ESO93920.1 hypothetical protein LOTGIDRAFT_153393 [Lottia gigantea]